MSTLIIYSKVSAELKVFDVGLIGRMNDKLNGIELSKGMETAKSLFEKTHPGVKIQLHRFSHDDDLESVVRSAQEVLKKKLPAVIGGELSQEAFVLRDAFKGKKIALISPTSTNPEVSNGQPHVFRFSPSDQRMAFELARVTLRKLKPKAIGVINNVSSPYSSFLSKQFIEIFATEQPKIENKVPVFEEKIIEDTVDLEAQIQRLMNAKVTHVVIPAHPSEFFHFVTQARAKGYFPTYIGGDGWGGSENIWKHLVENSTDGSTFIAYRTWLWNENLVTSLGSEFRKEYSLKYNAKPSGFSAIGFDAAWVLMSAMSRASDPKSGEQIMKALENLKDLTLVTRQKFSFGSDHSPSGGVHLYRIDANGIHFQETLE